MGKSKAKSKTEKRKRAVKRKLIEPMINKKIELNNEKIKMSINGLEYREPIKKNAFRYPNSPDSHFPQHVYSDIIDFRSHKNPFSGEESAVNFRNKTKAKNVVRARFTDEILKDEEEKQQKQNEEQNEIIQNELLNKFVKMDVKKTIKKNKGMLVENIKKRRFDRRKSKSSRIIKFN